jgi:hypothetical protein
MTQIPEWYDKSSLVVTLIGLFNCIVFCGWYWYRSRGSWMKSEYGWFLMMFIGCLGSLFALIVSNRIFGAWPYRLHVSLALYSSYVLITFWLPRLVWLSFRTGDIPSNKTPTDGGS